MHSSAPLCPVCAQGHRQPSTFVRSFAPRGQKVDVELLTSKCDHCAFESPLSAQHKENLARLAARKQLPQYDGVLLGEEILRLRKNYGLTQQAASKIFGKGKIAFSRYENEITYPDTPTSLLLTLAIKSRATVVCLAEMAGVELPLLSERQSESKAVVTLASAQPTGWLHPMEEHRPALLRTTKKVTEILKLLPSIAEESGYTDDATLEFYG